MDLELAPIGVGDFTADYKKFTIRLYQDGAEIGVWNESQKDGSVKLPKAFAAGVSGTHTYKVTFTWNDTDNNAKQTGMGQNGYSKSFKFSIKATQSVAASANNGQ